MILKPLNENRVNKKVARLNSAWVIAFGLIYLFIPSARWIIYVMLANFFIKGFVGPWYSPVSQINKYILKALKIKPELIFAPPKIFAAKIGFTFTLVTTVLYILGYLFASEIVLGVLLVCASLELLFEFCIGCYTHSLLFKTR